MHRTVSEAHGNSKHFLRASRLVANTRFSGSITTLMFLKKGRPGNNQPLSQEPNPFRLIHSSLRLCVVSQVLACTFRAAS